MTGTARSAGAAGARGDAACGAGWHRPRPDRGCRAAGSRWLGQQRELVELAACGRFTHVQSGSSEARPRTTGARGRLLLVEQNVERALSISDRAYILDQGVLVHTGTGAELLADREIQDKYCAV